MKIKRTYTDGTSDFIKADSLEIAKTRKVKSGKTLKTLQVIDVITGIVLALVNILKAVKN